MVPLSTTVTFGLATGRPIKPVNADVPLRLKSASSPCPTASCSRIPGQPGPSTTSISPAGAATAPSCKIAPRAASCARCSGLFDPTNCSNPDLPPPPADPFVVTAPSLGDHEHIQPAKRLRVAGKRPVRRRNQNPPQLLAVTWPAPAPRGCRTLAPRDRRAKSTPAAPPDPGRSRPAEPGRDPPSASP